MGPQFFRLAVTPFNKRSCL